MRVAIMQPTWLPWIGYFDLIDQVDLFVFLDTVQYRRRSWQSRNVLKTRDGLRYLSIPVANTGRDKTRIVDAVVRPTNHVEKWLRTIEQFYGRANAFRSHYPFIAEHISSIRNGDKLADVNIAFILKAMSHLGITTETVRASDLQNFDGRVERLVNIAKHLNAETYVSPPGAASYLRDGRKSFQDSGLSLCFQRYDHPVYPQCCGPFVGYVSIIDLLLNTGESAGSILRSGQRNPIPATEYLGDTVEEAELKNGDIEAA